jgi:myosin heavy subunit
MPVHLQNAYRADMHHILDVLCALYQEWDERRNSAWPKTDFRDVKNHFIVKHYAGPVKYCTDGWLMKNMDTITADITELCRHKCGVELVKDLWAPGRFATFTTTTATGQKIRQKFQGLGKAFLKSINELTTQIDSTHVHFIRSVVLSLRFAACGSVWEL